MVCSGRFRSFFVAPPCTTFSPAAYPSCRSYALPLGYDRSDGKTFHGNLLAFHSFTMLRAGFSCCQRRGSKSSAQEDMLMYRSKAGPRSLQLLTSKTLLTTSLWNFFAPWNGKAETRMMISLLLDWKACYHMMYCSLLLGLCSHTITGS